MVMYLNKKTKIRSKRKKKTKKIGVIYLFGVLFSTVKINGNLYFKLHFSYILFMEIPKQLQIYILKKRLILYGDIRHIKYFILNLMSFRIPNIYTGIGLREKNDNYIIKAGKIRKR